MHSGPALTVAEIAKVVEFEPFDSVMAQASERWDLVRARETSGGMLRNTCQPGKDPWRLRGLYGLDNEGFAPCGTFRTFQVYSKLATDPPKETETKSPDELKKEMLGIFDEEIERLMLFVDALQVIDSKRSEYQTTAALVPSQYSQKCPKHHRGQQ